MKKQNRCFLGVLFILALVVGFAIFSVGRVKADVLESCNWQLNGSEEMFCWDRDANQRSSDTCAFINGGSGGCTGTKCPDDIDGQGEWQKTKPSCSAGTKLKTAETNACHIVYYRAQDGDVVNGGNGGRPYRFGASRNRACSNAANDRTCENRSKCYRCERDDGGVSKVLYCDYHSFTVVNSGYTTAEACRNDGTSTFYPQGDAANWTDGYGYTSSGVFIANGNVLCADVTASRPEAQARADLEKLCKPPGGGTLSVKYCDTTTGTVVSGEYTPEDSATFFAKPYQEQYDTCSAEIESGDKTHLGGGTMTASEDNGCYNPNNSDAQVKEWTKCGTADPVCPSDAEITAAGYAPTGAKYPTNAIPAGNSAALVPSWVEGHFDMARSLADNNIPVAMTVDSITGILLANGAAQKPFTDYKTEANQIATDAQAGMLLCGIKMQEEERGGLWYCDPSSGISETHDGCLDDDGDGIVDQNCYYKRDGEEDGLAGIQNETPFTASGFPKTTKGTDECGYYIWYTFYKSASGYTGGWDKSKKELNCYNTKEEATAAVPDCRAGQLWYCDPDEGPKETNGGCADANNDGRVDAACGSCALGDPMDQCGYQDSEAGLAACAENLKSWVYEAHEPPYDWAKATAAMKKCYKTREEVIQAVPECEPKPRYACIPENGSLVVGEVKPECPADSNGRALDDCKWESSGKVWCAKGAVVDNCRFKENETLDADCAEYVKTKLYEANNQTALSGQETQFYGCYKTKREVEEFCKKDTCASEGYVGYKVALGDSEAAARAAATTSCTNGMTEAVWVDDNLDSGTKGELCYKCNACPPGDTSNDLYIDELKCIDGADEHALDEQGTGNDGFDVCSDKVIGGNKCTVYQDQPVAVTQVWGNRYNQLTVNDANICNDGGRLKQGAGDYFRYYSKGLWRTGGPQNCGNGECWTQAMVNSNGAGVPVSAGDCTASGNYVMHLDGQAWTDGLDNSWCVKGTTAMCPTDEGWVNMDQERDENVAGEGTNTADGQIYTDASGQVVRRPDETESWSGTTSCAGNFGGCTYGCCSGGGCPGSYCSNTGREWNYSYNPRSNTGVAKAIGRIYQGGTTQSTEGSGCGGTQPVYGSANTANNKVCNNQNDDSAGSTCSWSDGCWGDDNGNTTGTYQKHNSKIVSDPKNCTRVGSCSISSSGCSYSSCYRCTGSGENRSCGYTCTRSSTTYSANPNIVSVPYDPGKCQSGTEVKCLESRFDTNETSGECTVVRRCGRELTVEPEKIEQDFEFDAGGCMEQNIFKISLTAESSSSRDVNLAECTRESINLNADSDQQMTHAFNPCACKADRYVVEVSANDGNVNNQIKFQHNPDGVPIPGDKCAVLWHQMSARDGVNGLENKWGEAGKNGHWILDGIEGEANGWEFDEAQCRFVCEGDGSGGGVDCYGKVLKPRIYFVPDFRFVSYQDSQRVATYRNDNDGGNNACSVNGAERGTGSAMFSNADYQFTGGEGVYNPDFLNSMNSGGFREMYFGENLQNTINIKTEFQNTNTGATSQTTVDCTCPNLTLKSSGSGMNEFGNCAYDPIQLETADDVCTTKRLYAMVNEDYTSAWWQVSGGNVYAFGDIKDRIPNNETSLPGTKCLDMNYPSALADFSGINEYFTSGGNKSCTPRILRGRTPCKTDGPSNSAGVVLTQVGSINTFNDRDDNVTAGSVKAQLLAQRFSERSYIHALYAGNYVSNSAAEEVNNSGNKQGLQSRIASSNAKPVGGSISYDAGTGQMSGNPTDLGYIPPREDFAYFLNLANSAAQEGSGAQIGPGGKQTTTQHLNDLVNSPDTHCVPMQESNAESESWVCYINNTGVGDLVIDASNPWTLRKGAKYRKFTIFVEGNVIMRNSDGYNSDRAAISVDVGNFLSLVISGNITVDKDVGLVLPNPYTSAGGLNPQVDQCWEGQSAAVPGYTPDAGNVPDQNSAAGVTEGIFIADGNLTIQTRREVGDCNVETDKRYVHQGSMVVWGNATLERDFSNRERNCQAISASTTQDDAFGIYNNRIPAETFIYRPDLVVNIPSWMRRSTVYTYQE